MRGGQLTYLQQKRESALDLRTLRHHPIAPERNSDLLEPVVTERNLKSRQPCFLTALLVVVILLQADPPACAQTPAPLVTITGIFDQVTSAGKNFYDANFTRDNDREWYARTRFRPNFSLQVGRTKAVLGLEIDLVYGQTGSNDGGFPTNNTGSPGGIGIATGGTKLQTNGNLDLNTDVGAMIEIKWIYTEFDLTGKDGLLWFVPVQTVARAGGQPFASLASYKLATYAFGDFAGVSTLTTFAPGVKLSLAYVALEDQLAGGNRAAATARTSRGEDFAVIVSPEITPFPGLNLKPLYSYFHADGVTSFWTRRNLVNRRSVGGVLGATASMGGGAPAGDSTNHEDRHTIGLDARWRLGAFGLDPTVYYQWGTLESQALTSNGVRRVEADESAWLVDVIGSFQTGPLVFELRANYSTGNKARDNLSRRIRYFQPLNTDGAYYTGWAAIMGLGVDYLNGIAMDGMGSHIGYDRYGRAQIGARVTFNFSPALSVYAIASPTWTAEKVDTDTNSGIVPTAVSLTAGRTTVDDRSWVEGDSRHLGTESLIGLTWRWAPNAAFDLQGSWFAAGDALNTAELVNGVHTRRRANDAYTAAARVRVAF